jgi:hypothetical protein
MGRSRLVSYNRALVVAVVLGVGGMLAVVRSDLPSETVDWLLGAIATGLLVTWAIVHRSEARKCIAIVPHDCIDSYVPGRTSADDLQFAVDYFKGPTCFAIMTDATVNEVRAWAGGKRPVSTASAERVAHLVLVARQQTALDASGLPRCEWLAAAWPDGAKRPVVSDDERDAHSASCPVCLARDAFLESFSAKPTR